MAGSEWKETTKNRKAEDRLSDLIVKMNNYACDDYEYDNDYELMIDEYPSSAKKHDE